MTVRQLRYRSGLPVTEIRKRSGEVIWSSAQAGATWQDCDFGNAILDDIVIEGAAIALGSFAGTSLKRCDFYWLLAPCTSFVAADLEDCAFHGCGLGESDFTGAILRRTRFLRDNLGGGTDLCGANLSAAVIESADFSGAEYDDATRFPPDFDPEQHGMMRVVPRS